MLRRTYVLSVAKLIVAVFLSGSVIFCAGCEQISVLLELLPSHKTMSDVTFPADPNVRTQKDVYKSEYEWMVRNVVDPYKRKHIEDSDCDGEIESFLDNVCRLYSNYEVSLDARALADNGKTILDNGCDDPFFLLWYGNILNRNKDHKQAEMLIMQSGEAVAAAGYPTINMFFAENSLGEIAGEVSGWQDCELAFWKNNTVDSLGNALEAGVFKEDEMQIVYHLLSRSKLGDKIWRDFFHRLNPIEGGDSWLKNIVEAEMEIDAAWDERGSGWGYEVTEEGWKGFKEHLNKAYSVLKKAWKLRPEYPEAATLMLIISKTGYAGEGETDELWFSRAVAAQFDYLYAYKNYLTAALPRWGGDHNKMVSFGEKCLKTERFDTDVPLYYLLALRDMARDIENNCWRSAFRKQDVRENLNKLFQGLLAEPTRHKDRDRILMQQALTKMWQGDYKEAKVMFEQINDSVDLLNGFCGKALSWSARSRDIIDAELRAFTGRYSDVLKKAEMFGLDGDFKKSEELFIKVMNEYKDDTAIYAYLRRRIGLQMAGVRARIVPSTTSALHIAAQENHLQAVSFLIENGADVNASNFFNDTPLSLACDEGCTNIARVLLENGANLDMRNKRGRTSLFQACRKRNEDLVVLLVQHGADVNISDKTGHTPLTISIYYHFPEIAKYLIKNGADIHKQSNDGWNALHMALYYGEPGIAIMLINDYAADVNKRNGKSATPLMLAIHSDYPELCQLLIEKGADVNARTNNRWTPLHFSAHYGRPQIILMLLEQGADPNAKLPSGETPLDIARKNTKKKCFEILSEIPMKI